MTRRPVTLPAIVLLAASAFLAAQARPEIHCKHFLFGYPFGTPASNDLIIRDVYALSNNDETKFADWVAFRLDPWTVASRSDQSRDWKADPWLSPDETLEPSRPDDYRGVGAVELDRGHQAPLASFRGELSWRDTNLLSNITPQRSDLNQGPWRLLEDAERRLVETWTTVWVMTGPLYERDMPALPNADEPHKVPSGYWRIVATGDPSNPDSIRAVAFIFDQETPRSDRFEDHIVKIDEVETRSKLDFFWDMPDEIEERLEGTTGAWPPLPQGNP